MLALHRPSDNKAINSKMEILDLFTVNPNP